ncbi:ERF family protein [Virgibacillus siamensis]|uniref:ERF family protein n=1 Tax=Virgibacillus siamensis TaxID=480071 RepID=UPI0009853071|nr:ERF family protein [Virgibacillus siamensis]
MSEKKLVKKLAEVMKQVKYIQKKGFNNFNKYKYATESDVQEKIREVLAEQEVIMLPDVVEHTTREHTNRSGKTEYIATVKVKFTFIDGETGEELSIHSAGEGQDSGDKAVYKAITGAQKYALMKAFMIPTGDDPEADNGVDERNSGKQSKSKQQKQETNPLNSEITTKFATAIQTAGGKDALYEKLGKSKKDMETLLQSGSKKQKEGMINQLDTILIDGKGA